MQGARGARACVRARHGTRPIDANERYARSPQGKEMRPVPQPSSNAAATMAGEIPPERHIAFAERPRILPVIERRVVVPAFVASGTAGAELLALGFGFGLRALSLD